LVLSLSLPDLPLLAYLERLQREPPVLLLAASPGVLVLWGLRALLVPWEPLERWGLLEPLGLPVPAQPGELLQVPEPEWRLVKAWQAAPVGLRVLVYGS
jgi:hypothetical protein